MLALSEELYKSLLARYIDQIAKLAKKTIDTYQKEWVVVHEALQNALDAIYLSQKPTGIIEIILDVAGNNVQVFDNGVGFPQDRKYLVLGATDKDRYLTTRREVLGNIGVGLKTVLLSSKEFHIESVRDGFKWQITVKDGYKFLLGELDKTIIIEGPKTPLEKESYTIIRYIFPDIKDPRFPRVVDLLNHIYEVVWKHIPEEYKKGLPREFLFKIMIEYYFRTQSYAANILKILQEDHQIKDVKIRLIIKNWKNAVDYMHEGLKSILSEIDSDEIITEFANKYWDPKEFESRLLKILREITSPISIPRVREAPVNLLQDLRVEPNVLILLRIPREKVSEALEYLIPEPRKRIEREEVNKLKEYIIDKINGMLIILGKRVNLRKIMFNPVRLISARGMPTTHNLIDPKKTGALGALLNMHVIIDVDGEFNYGKRQITNTRLVRRVRELFEYIFRELARAVLKSYGEETPSTSYELLERAAQEPFEDPRSREDLCLKDLSIKKVPKEEIEVIALFYELMGKGYIEKFETYALSSIGKYDGKIWFSSKTGRTDITATQLLNLEFKRNLSSLIDELEKGNKSLKEIALVVAWKDDVSTSSASVDYLVRTVPTNYDKIHPAVNRIIEERTTGIKRDVIILNELIEELCQK